MKKILVVLYGILVAFSPTGLCAEELVNRAYSSADGLASGTVIISAENPVATISPDAYQGSSLPGEKPPWVFSMTRVDLPSGENVSAEQKNTAQVTSALPNVNAKAGGNISAKTNGTVQGATRIETNLTAVAWSNNNFQDAWGMANSAGGQVTETLIQSATSDGLTTTATAAHAIDVTNTAIAPGAVVTVNANANGTNALGTTTSYRVETSNSVFGAPGNYNSNVKVKYQKTGE